MVFSAQLVLSQKVMCIVSIDFTSIYIRVNRILVNKLLIRIGCLGFPSYNSFIRLSFDIDRHICILYLEYISKYKACGKYSFGFSPHFGKGFPPLICDLCS